MIKQVCLCRGDGKVFIKFKLFDRAQVRGRVCEQFRAQAYRLEATASALGSSDFSNGLIPAQIYPLYNSCDFAILEVPLLPIKGLVVHVDAVDAEGAHHELGSYKLSYEKAKWASRLNYRIHPGTCAEMRTYAQEHPGLRYNVEVMRCLEGEDGLIWRLKISWCGNPDAKPALRVMDPRGKKIDHREWFFEFQSDVVNTYFVSVGLPVELTSFLIIADDPQSDRSQSTFENGAPTSGPTGALTAGFCAVDPSYYDALRGESEKYTQDAYHVSEKVYADWLEKHRTPKDELEKLKALSSNSIPQLSSASQPNTVPRFSVVLVADFATDSSCVDAQVRELIEQSIATLKEQLCSSWELVVVFSQKNTREDLISHVVQKYGNEQIRVVAASSDEALIDLGIKESRGDYVAFLQVGDTLEPDALARYGQTLDRFPDTKLLYCDEDMRLGTKSYRAPLFKTRLNLDLLYSYNCIGNLLMVDRSILADLDQSRKTCFDARLYDIVLQVVHRLISEEKSVLSQQIVHIPYLLFHSGAYLRNLKNGDSSSRRGAKETQAALLNHLSERKIRAHVEPYERETFELASAHFRVHYHVPKPHPLVSILIPSKDHTAMLKACLDSILDRATYDNYEIVVIENNSTRPETFGYYRDIEAHSDLVRVVRWNEEFNFSKIINFGARQARGDYLLILNNDTEVITSTFIEEMLGLFQRPEVGVVGAKLFFRDELVQHAGIKVGPFGAVAHVNQNFNRSRAGYRDQALCTSNFSAVTGACQLVSKAVFDQVGGYDERFAVGFNDVDFCLRVRQAGYLVVFTPFAELYHYEFVSRGRETLNPEKQKRWESERALFQKRWPLLFAAEGGAEDAVERGDPYSNPNLERDSAYYALGGI